MKAKNDGVFLTCRSSLQNWMVSSFSFPFMRTNFTPSVVSAYSSKVGSNLLHGLQNENPTCKTTLSLSAMISLNSSDEVMKVTGDSLMTSDHHTLNSWKVTSPSAEVLIFDNFSGEMELPRVWRSVFRASHLTIPSPSGSKKSNAALSWPSLSLESCTVSCPTALLSVSMASACLSSTKAPTAAPFTNAPTALETGMISGPLRAREPRISSTSGPAVYAPVGIKMIASGLT